MFIGHNSYYVKFLLFFCSVNFMFYSLIVKFMKYYYCSPEGRPIRISRYLFLCLKDDLKPKLKNKKLVVLNHFPNLDSDSLVLIPITVLPSKIRL